MLNDSFLKKKLNKFGYFSSSKKGLFTKIGSLFDRGFYLFLYVLATSVVSISCAFVSSNNTWWWGITVGIILLVIATLGNHYDMEESKELVTKLRSQLKVEENNVRRSGDVSERTGIKLQETTLKLIETHEQIVTSILKSIFKNLDLDTYTRVSIYFEENNKFSILGRYSRNPKYKEIHTRVFHINKGALSKAWEHGEYSSSECCSYADNKLGYQEYQLKEFNYSLEQTEKLTMKSREYVGIALSHIDEHIGVILFESESEAFVDDYKNGIIEQVDKYHSQLSDRIISGKIIYSENSSVKNVDEDFISSMKHQLKEAS